MGWGITLIQQQKIRLLAVVGPTASGKTRLAIELAKQYNGEVVSADSMQVYRGMDIGTAKPTEQEMDGVPHHLISIVEPDSVFSVADYLAAAHEAIADIAARGRLPIVAGGTGMYINSLLEDTAFADDTRGDKTIRQQLYAEAEQFGGQPLYDRLLAIDPRSALATHPNNIARVVRALEVYLKTGVTMSEHQANSHPHESRYNALKLGMNYRDRAVLYDRINRRVDMMLEQGLLEEARAIFEAGHTGTAMQAIGYKEMFGYLRGEQSLEHAVERLKQASRRYAKRQLTWFKRDNEINWIYMDDFGERNIVCMQKNIKITVDNFLNICYDKR